jgi:polyisoprenyl-phosphate glycosyltransferase
MKKISVITGVFNEEAILEDVYFAIKQEMKELSKRYDYEHIFMDNCSTDKTLQILKKIAKKDKHIKILSFSRNFGPEKSGWMGLMHASGDVIIPYEGSMKDPIELIPTLLKHWENGFELVMAVRKSTQDSLLMQYLRKFFYRLVNLVSKESLPRGFGSFSVIDKKIINELKKIDDYKPYARGLIATMGFSHKKVIYERRARPKGKGRSKSTLPYLVDFAINGLISYSIFPIRLMTYMGLGLSSLSFFGAIIYLILKLFYWKVTIPGITGVIILILFFSGIQLFFLGIIGEYVGAIHSQVRKKPFVVIKEKINFKK